MPVPEPSPAPAPNAQGSAEPAVSAECASGPVPPPPGEQPVVSRRISIDADGNAEVTTVRLGGLAEVRSASVDPERLARIRAQARIVPTLSSLVDETPVPDGTTCRVEILLDGSTYVRQANVPAGHPGLRPLLDDLIAVRDAPPPLAR